MFFHLLESFLTAIVATSGAFIPIFILMTVHYNFRKAEYQKIKERYVKFEKALKDISSISDVYVNTIYQQLGAANYEEFLEKSKNNYSLVRSINEELKNKEKNLKRSIEIILRIKYIESYNFKSYVAMILERRFPDERLKTGKSIES